MKKMFKKLVQIPIYPGRILIVFTEDVDIVKEYFSDYDSPVVTGVTGVSPKHSNLYTVTVIVNPNIKDISGLMTIHGVIAHEALHVVQEVFYNVGIEMDLDNPEPANYFLGWVVEEMYKVYNKIK